jgi:hypothetical protein
MDSTPAVQATSVPAIPDEAGLVSNEGEDPTPYLASALVKAVLNDGKQKRANESERNTPNQLLQFRIPKVIERV